jgi:hypothetical protein
MRLDGIIEGLERLLAHHHHHAEQLERIERNQETIMAGIQELNDAIAALPQKVADSVIPLIPVPVSPPPSNGGVDTTSQIEALALVPSQVASLVSAALAAPPPPFTPPPPPVAPSPTVVTNADGSVTTTTFNTDGTVASVTTVDASGNVIPNP